MVRTDPTSAANRLAAAGSTAAAIAAITAAVIARQDAGLPPPIADWPNTYYLTEWMLDEDEGDLYPGFDRALQDCRDRKPGVINEGCRFVIPPGTYSLSDTVVLCRQHTVEGHGGRGWGARTVIEADAGVTGFRVGSIEECSDAAVERGAGGGWSELRNFALTSPAGDEATLHYGIVLNARADLNALNIGGFTQGVRVQATTTEATPCPLVPLPDGGPGGSLCAANANGWSIRDTRIAQNDHAGIYVQGGEANAFYVSNLDVSESCRDADALASSNPELGDCAAVVDDSFLGGVWIGVQTATSTDTTTATDFPGFEMRNANASSTVIGPYAELDQESSLLAGASMAIGGVSIWDASTGFRQRGFIANAVVYRNDEDPTNVVDVALGYTGNPGTAFEIRSNIFNSGWPLRLEVEKILVGGQDAGECAQCTTYAGTVGGSTCANCYDGHYLFQVANLAAAEPLRIDASENGSYPRGTLWLDQEPQLAGATPTEVCLSSPTHTCP